MAIRHRLWRPSDVPQDCVSNETVTGPTLLPNRRVVVEPYTDAWSETFGIEAARIRLALGDGVVQLHHVGSTSVRGLSAKPIVDIDLIVEHPEDESTYLPALEAAGYRLAVREPEWEEHRCFTGPGAAVNVHVFGPDAVEWRRHLLFRNWLERNDADRQLYSEHKVSLSEVDFDHLLQYQAAKNDIVTEIYDRAFSADLVDHPERAVEIPDARDGLPSDPAPLASSAAAVPSIPVAPVLPGAPAPAA